MKITTSQGTCIKTLKMGGTEEKEPVAAGFVSQLVPSWFYHSSSLVATSQINYLWETSSKTQVAVSFIIPIGIPQSNQVDSQHLPSYTRSRAQL